MAASIAKTDGFGNDWVEEIQSVYVVHFHQSWAESPCAGVKAVFTDKQAAERFAEQDSDYEVEEVPIDPPSGG